MSVLQPDVGGDVPQSTGGIQVSVVNIAYHLLCVSKHNRVAPENVAPPRHTKLNVSVLFSTAFCFIGLAAKTLLVKMCLFIRLIYPFALSAVFQQRKTKSET